MADIRQYIGARYVFKIYENSQDASSAEWESGVAYEPLTIVTYMNSTYASKKDVPGSIGNPAANPMFWVVTGAYNGQIATLQHQIDDINNTELPSINSAIQTLRNEIDKLALNKVFILTDSYGGTAGNASGDNTTIGSILDTIAPDMYTVLAASGRSVGSGTYLTYLQEYCAQSGFDGSIYGTFLIATGRNEWSSSNQQITEQTPLLLNYIKAQFPNAKIKYCWIANGDNNTAHGTKAQQYDSYRRLKAAMENNGVGVITGTECVLHNYNYLNADGVHPTANGKLALAWAIHSGLQTGHYSTENPLTDMVLTAESGVTIGYATEAYRSEMCDNMVSIYEPAISVYTLSAPLTQTNYAEIPLASIGADIACMVRYVTHDIAFNTDVRIVNPSDTTQQLELNCHLVITPEGKISLKNVQTSAAIRALNSGLIYCYGFGVTTISGHIS